MAIPLSSLATWLTGQGIANVCINWVPDTPDAVVVVSGGGGTAPEMDGLFEGTHIHVTTRTASDAAAETTALHVHALLSPINVGGSLTIGETRVLGITPSAPPTFLGRDLRNRTMYIATYLVMASA